MISTSVDLATYGAARDERSAPQRSALVTFVTHVAPFQLLGIAVSPPIIWSSHTSQNRSRSILRTNRLAARLHAPALSESEERRTIMGNLRHNAKPQAAPLDLQSLARPDRGLRSVVCAAAVAFVFFAGFERARRGRLRSTCWRSSSTIRTTWRRFTAPTIAPKTSRNTASSQSISQRCCADAAVVAFLAAPAALDLHHLFDLEPVALQRTKLWAVHDVRPPGWGDPDKAERRALYGAFVVSYLILFLGFHTGPSTDPLFLSLGIPAVVSRWEQIVLGIAFLGLSAFGLSRLARVHRMAEADSVTHACSLRSFFGSCCPRRFH